MSRHRDVRCMNYSDEYDGYDDVYGHSVEDDYCVSPSAEQFLFDRSKQQNIASFITEPDIVEDNEDVDELAAPSNEKKLVLTELEQAKLLSCMEAMKKIIGDTVPEAELKEKIIKSGFDPKVTHDLILKESSPKTVSEPQTASKDRSEHYSAPTVTMSQLTSFTIPKFSCKKHDNMLKETSSNARYINNIDSLQNLAISSPSTSFSSLTQMLNSNKKSTLPASTKLSVETDSNTSFGTLADLTAYHLQKSSNSIDSTNNDTKVFSPNTNFKIPKLSFTNEKNYDLRRERLLVKINAQSDTKCQLNLTDVEEKNDSIDTLQESLSNYLVLSKNDTKNSLEDFENKFVNTTGRMNNTRTQSPDDWMIDLSVALKEADFLNSKNSSKSDLQPVSNSYKNFSSLQEHTFTEDTVMPYIILPTTFDLSSLKNTKLPQAKKVVSPFGRTLCRTWKLKKQVLKSQKQQYHTVKRFDFSTPYTRT